MPTVEIVAGTPLRPPGVIYSTVTGHTPCRAIFRYFAVKNGDPRSPSRPGRSGGDRNSTLIWNGAMRAMVARSGPATPEKTERAIGTVRITDMSAMPPSIDAHDLRSVMYKLS
jgi:hypothetical protein